MNRMRRRSQALSFDLVIALGIAVLLWGILAASFSQGSRRFTERGESSELTLQAMHIADTLTMTPGFPTGWERAASADGIDALGLAQSPRVIASEKFAALTRLPVDDTTELLNLPPHRFNLTLRSTAGATLVSYGNLDSARNETRITLQRQVRYNGTTRILELTLQQ